jgi:hypothetical protein
MIILGKTEYENLKASLSTAINMLKIQVQELERIRAEVIDINFKLTKIKLSDDEPVIRDKNPIANTPKSWPRLKQELEREDLRRSLAGK